MATRPDILNSAARVADGVSPSLIQVAARALFRTGGASHKRRSIGTSAFPQLFNLLSALVIAAILLALVTVVTASILTGLERRELTAHSSAAAAKLRAHAQVISLAQDRDGIARMMEQVPASAIFHSLAARLPAGARIAALERDSHGMLSLEIALNDPDVLDTAFEGDAVLGRLVQSRQWSDGLGRLRVTLRGRQK